MTTTEAKWAVWANGPSGQCYRVGKYYERRKDAETECARLNKDEREFNRGSSGFWYAVDKALTD